MKGLTIGFIVLSVSTPALAATSDGASCAADAPAPAQQLFDTVQSALVTVRDSHSRVSLCDAPPRMTFDASLENPVLSMTIPIAHLKTEPLSAAGFGGQIASVSVPAPWSTDEAQTRFTVKNGILNITTPVNPSAWGQVPGEVLIHLASGQLVIVDVAAPKVVIDETANVRASAAGSLAMAKGDLAIDLQSLARLKGWIANPSTIPFDSEAARSSTQQDLAKQQAAIASQRAALAALWATANQGVHTSAYSSLTGYLSPDLATAYAPMASTEMNQANALAAARHQADQASSLLAALVSVDAAPAEIAKARQDAADANAAVSARQSDLAAADAAIGKWIDAHGLGDELLATSAAMLTPDHGQDLQIALRMQANDQKELAGLNALAAQQQGAKLANAKTSLTGVNARISADQNRIIELKKELATPMTTHRDYPTKYVSGCPAS